MDVSTAAGWTTVAAEPINGASIVGAGEGAAVRVGSEVMVIAPVGAAGEAPARMPPAIARTANERTAGLLITALPPCFRVPKSCRRRSESAAWSESDQR